MFNQTPFMLNRDIFAVMSFCIMIIHVQDQSEVTEETLISL